MTCNSSQLLLSTSTRKEDALLIEVRRTTAQNPSKGRETQRERKINNCFDEDVLLFVTTKSANAVGGCCCCSFLYDVVFFFRAVLLTRESYSVKFERRRDRWLPNKKIAGSTT
jgi:hypothetical protein